MSLDAYLSRLGLERPARAGRDFLFAIHRAHLAAIPYENLEIQLGRENRLSEDAFLDKLVRRRRGGWCYEMNGTLTWALDQLGYRVTRVAGAVGRKYRGDSAVGNHLVGMVDLDGGRFVVDVGLGDGPLEPFPLEERAWSEAGLEFRLERLDAQWWRLHNHPHGLAHSFDFTEEPRQLAWYQGMCTLLQTAEISPFVQFALLIRRDPEGTRALRDTHYLRVTRGHPEMRRIESLEDYGALVGELLGVDLGAEVERLWKRARERDARRDQEAKTAEDAAGS